MFAHITPDRKKAIIQGYVKRLADDARTKRFRMVDLSDDQMEIITEKLAKRLGRG